MLYYRLLLKKGSSRWVVTSEQVNRSWEKTEFAISFFVFLNIFNEIQKKKEKGRKGGIFSHLLSPPIGSSTTINTPPPSIFAYHFRAKCKWDDMVWFFLCFFFYPVFVVVIVRHGSGSIPFLSRQVDKCQRGSYRCAVCCCCVVVAVRHHHNKSAGTVRDLCRRHNVWKQQGTLWLNVARAERKKGREGGNRITFWGLLQCCHRRRRTATWRPKSERAKG